MARRGNQYREDEYAQPQSSRPASPGITPQGRGGRDCPNFRPGNCEIPWISMKRRLQARTLTSCPVLLVEALCFGSRRAQSNMFNLTVQRSQLTVPVIFTPGHPCRPSPGSSVRRASRTHADSGAECAAASLAGLAPGRSAEATEIGRAISRSHVSYVPSAH